MLTILTRDNSAPNLQHLIYLVNISDEPGYSMERNYQIYEQCLHHLKKSQEREKFNHKI